MNFEVGDACCAKVLEARSRDMATTIKRTAGTTLFHSGDFLLSSSGPAGACITPSRGTNSSTLTLLMTEFLGVLSDFI
jgi:hypothetical protein